MGLPYFQGLFFAASLLVSIGPQNAHVLRQGLLRRWVFTTAAICALSDVALVTLGVAGFGQAIAQHPQLMRAVAAGGALFLLSYAVRSFQAALKPQALAVTASAGGQGLAGAIGTAAAFTWLNPLVYLDTVVLVGSFSATLGPDRWSFGLGAMTCAIAWFFSLAYGARLLADWFARPAAWRVLDTGVGLLSLYLAVTLLGKALV